MGISDYSTVHDMELTHLFASSGDTMSTHECICATSKFLLSLHGIQNSKASNWQKLSLFSLGMPFLSQKHDHGSWHIVFVGEARALIMSGPGPFQQEVREWPKQTVSPSSHEIPWGPGQNDGPYRATCVAQKFIDCLHIIEQRSRVKLSWVAVWQFENRY